MKNDPDPSTPARWSPFVWLLIGVTLAFVLILSPYSGAVWWALFLAIVFTPLQRRLDARMRGRHENIAALATLSVIVVIVLLPLALLGTAIGQEVGTLVERIRSGQFDLAASFRRIFDILPGWLKQLLDRLGLGDLATLQGTLTDALAQSSRAISGGLFNAGQQTLDWLLSFVLMLYVLYFLLRDGDRLSARVLRIAPLAFHHKEALAERFVKVVRATVQGNVLVALVQGLLGTLAFWFLGIQGALLWGAVMAVLSMLPAVGSALVWGPVALYLLAVGQIWQCVALTLWGTLVIGLVDNLLRPALVSKSTHIPDYVVLIATVGGIAVFGINGFVLGPIIAGMFLGAWEIYGAEHVGGDTDPALPAGRPGAALQDPGSAPPPAPGTRPGVARIGRRRPAAGDRGGR